LFLHEANEMISRKNKRQLFFMVGKNKE